MLRKITPTTTAPYRLRFLTTDFPATGAKVIEWRYRFSTDDFVAVARRVERRDGENFHRETHVALPAECTIRARDFTDEVATVASETIVREF